MTEPKEIPLTDLNGSERTSPVWQMDVNTKSNVKQSWKSDKCAFKCDIIKYILVSFISLGYLISKFSEYNDESKNSITSSTVESITEYTMPYIAFYPLSHFNVEEIAVFEVTKKDVMPKRVAFITKKEINETYVTNSSISNFVYDSSITSYQLLHLVDEFNNESLITFLVPPYGQQLAFNQHIDYRLTSYTRCDCHDPYSWLYTLCPNQTKIANDAEYRAKIVDMQQSLGSLYGIYWTVDAVEYLQNSFEYLSRADPYSMHLMPLASAITGQLSLTEKINEWDDTKNEFYETKIVASFVGIDEWVEASDIEEYCLKFENAIFLRIDPTGDGIKTIITISRLKGWLDILSATGGLFSPSLTGLTVLFGFLLTAKWFGCARKQGCSDAEKLKIALYLQELGLLTDDLHQQAIQFKRLNGDD